jgi:NAD(P)-dependent dehydrogenase (short-subunit alcohol dehydrogenase family)
MKKNILITGATDGIGYETAKTLVEQGHVVLLHGRNQEKLNKVSREFAQLAEKSGAHIESYRADLSDLAEVKTLAENILASDILNTRGTLGVLINNAGVFKTDQPISSAGLDVRFVVNTLAPYLLTQLLLPVMNSSSRVLNLSSAAQAPVNLDALTGRIHLQDPMAAYAQSKLAITIWSQSLAKQLAPSGPIIMAINPGSLLASKMVKEGFGMAGNDIRIGAEILIHAAISDEFAQAYGQYFDNDSGQFSMPHSDAQDIQKTKPLMQMIESLVSSHL